MVLPLDMPDDYPWLPGARASALSDLGELAVRLGSPVSFDRRGSVYWYDSFENGLSPWLTKLGGTGSSIRITHKHVFSGYLTCKCVSGSDGDRISGVIKRLAPAMLTTLGLEVTFSVDVGVNEVQVQLHIHTGTTSYLAQLLLDIDTQALFYYNNAGSYIKVSDVTIYNNDPDLFSTIKLVIDSVNKQYVRAILNQTEHDLTGIQLYEQSGVLEPRIETLCAIRSAAGQNGTGYLDNVIVTIGDP